MAEVLSTAALVAGADGAAGFLAERHATAIVVHADGCVDHVGPVDGYALDLTRGWVGKPALAYPDAFWHGLGVRRTNVAHSPPAS